MSKAKKTFKDDIERAERHILIVSCIVGYSFIGLVIYAFVRSLL